MLASSDLPVPLFGALMTKAVGLALVIDLTAARQVFGDYPGRRYVLAASFVLIVVGLFYQDAVLIRVQQKARRDPRRGKPL